MHLLALTSILVAAAGLCHAQADNSTDNAADHWCGKWAGSPNPGDVPTGQQLPVIDFTRRLFVEPQLQRTPFAPVTATEDKVQVPKIWGNSRPSITASFSCQTSISDGGNTFPDEFRVALLSYADTSRTYASSKSRWTDFAEALGLVMQKCVSQGSGGAYLVPRTASPLPPPSILQK